MFPVSVGNAYVAEILIESAPQQQVMAKSQWSWACSCSDRSDLFDSANVATFLKQSRISFYIWSFVVAIEAIAVFHATVVCNPPSEQTGG